jgi:hypothetical protein
MSLEPRAQAGWLIALIGAVLPALVPSMPALTVLPIAAFLCGAGGFLLVPDRQLAWIGALFGALGGACAAYAVHRWMQDGIFRGKTILVLAACAAVPALVVGVVVYAVARQRLDDRQR